MLIRCSDIAVGFTLTCWERLSDFGIEETEFGSPDVPEKMTRYLLTMITPPGDDHFLSSLRHICF